MLRKLDVEQNMVPLEEEKTELATVAADKEVKYDFRIQKETDGTEYNMNREKNKSENYKDGNNKDSNQISKEKKELSDTNIVEDRENA